jgi:hypothetical protein
MMGGPATHDRERTKVGLSAGDLVPGSTSEYKRQKTAETLLNILEGRIRNPNTRNAWEKPRFPWGNQFRRRFSKAI